MHGGALSIANSVLVPKVNVVIAVYGVPLNLHILSRPRPLFKLISENLITMSIFRRDGKNIEIRFDPKFRIGTISFFDFIFMHCFIVMLILLSYFKKYIKKMKIFLIIMFWVDD